MIVDDLADLAVPLHHLESLPGNPRRGDVDAVMRSYSVFGQRKPLVARRTGEQDGRPTGIVIAGNHQLEAARRLGWAEVAVVWVDDDDLTAKAFALADNRTADLGSYDDEALAAMLADVAVSSELLAASAYTDEDLARLLRGDPEPGLTDEDEPVEVPEEPRSRPGDLWLLGDHRLLCGDATDPAALARLLDGAAPRLCVTDPPYGVNYEAAWRDEAAAKGQIAFAARRTGKVVNDDRSDWSAVWQLVPSDVFYCWHAGVHAAEVVAGIAAAGFEIRAQIIWAKPHFVIGRGAYHVGHEPCWYAVRKGKNAGWVGDRSQTTLWGDRLDRNVEGEHSTQKPVALMRRPLENHRGDVLDPFVGSGSTLIGAEQMRRRCFAMEIDPGYVDAVCRRWQRFTGRVPVAAETGSEVSFVEEVTV